MIKNHKIELITSILRWKKNVTKVKFENILSEWMAFASINRWIYTRVPSEGVWKTDFVLVVVGWLVVLIRGGL